MVLCEELLITPETMSFLYKWIAGDGSYPYFPVWQPCLSFLAYPNASSE